ncbi:Bcr/CflA family efflux MFS transporter [Isoalcanivorax beigongshangi]|uniref:Bcr/CflA family efflux transporter n=1 Tax=Isoalcanivorax beigongshangi TaxID=3238810 RepID=A0ABV4AE04_9GAMM
MSHPIPRPSSTTATLLLLCPFDLLASLAMDLYLPALPRVTTDLSATTAQIQASLTLYLVLIGAGQLLFGPWSDRIGRRPVLLGGGMVYALASLMLALSTHIDGFLFWRVIQALGASACLVAVFAGVRDLYGDQPQAQRLYAQLAALLVLVPALGPLLGAVLTAAAGWPVLFLVLAAAMALALTRAARHWPETRPATAAHPGRLWTPLRHRHFWAYLWAYSAAMGAFFLFFSTSPWLLMERHGLPPWQFSLLFASVALVMASVAWRRGRQRHTPPLHRTARWAMVWLASGGALLLVSEYAYPKQWLGLMLPMWWIAVGIAMASSVALHGALQQLDHMAGTATAVFFCLGGALIGATSSALLQLLPTHSHWPLALYCLLWPLLCLALLRDPH